MMHQGTMHQTGKHKTKEEIPERKIINIIQEKQITIQSHYLYDKRITTFSPLTNGTLEYFYLLRTYVGTILILMG